MRKIIVAIGDSLIKGNPKPEIGGWIGICFNKDIIKERVILINSGSGGDNILDVRKRIFSDCLNYNPIGVIFGIGVNDSRVRDSLKGANEVPLEKFRKHLIELIDVILDNNVKSIFIVTPFPVVDRFSDPFKPDKRYQKKWVQEYRKVIIEVAKIKNLWLFDKWDEWDFYPELKLMNLLVDGVHPSEKGYQLISEQAINEIDKWLTHLGV